MISARILVLNYNGEQMLPETIPTLLAACARSVYGCRLSVIDNESTDQSVEWLKARLPDVPIWPMPNRLLCSYNDAAAASKEDVLIFLNNDVKVDVNFIDALVKPFESRPELFLVAPKVMDYEGKTVTGGPSTLWMSGGLIRSAMRADGVVAAAGATFAAGCAAAIDRKKFLELGGYDAMYLPGTVEDMDLCYRAWEKGYHCEYEPKSVVFHKGQSSFHKRFGARGTSEINARNIYLFMWKNFDSAGLWAAHLVFLVPRFAWALLRGQAYWISGFFKALKKYPEVAAARKKRKLQKFSRRDSEILELFRQKSAQ